MAQIERGRQHQFLETHGSEEYWTSQKEYETLLKGYETSLKEEYETISLKKVHERG